MGPPCLEPGKTIWYGFSRQTFLGGLKLHCVIAVAVLAAAQLVGAGVSVRNPIALLAAFGSIPGIWLVLSGAFSTTWLKLDDHELAWSAGQ